MGAFDGKHLCVIWGLFSDGGEEKKKKWVSLHLLWYTAPQCLLFLLEVSGVVDAAAYCQDEQWIQYGDSAALVSSNGMCIENGRYQMFDLFR